MRQAGAGITYTAPRTRSQRCCAGLSRGVRWIDELGLGVNFSTVFDSPKTNEASGNCSLGSTMLCRDAFDRSTRVKDGEKLVVFLIGSRTPSVAGE